MRILRVFPRKTSHTPDDDMAFVGDPPLFRPEADEVHVSVTFTWDVPEGERLAEAWAHYYPEVKLGGPAIDGEGGEFTPGMYVRKGVTFTSRGCHNKCGWCLVDRPIELLKIKPGYVVQDNNLLATGRTHMHAVFGMLWGQKRGAIFAGGFESELVDDWVAEQLRTMRVETVFLAADTDRALEPLREAVGKLAFLGRNKLRCYVMIGLQSIEDAEKRLRAVWEAGCIPFAQLYQPAQDKRTEYGRDWRNLARTWSRPAAMRALMKKEARRDLWD